MAEDFDFELERGTAIRFLLEFADVDGEFKYMNILQDVANRKYKAIQIDLEDLLNYEDGDTQLED